MNSAKLNLKTLGGVLITLLGVHFTFQVLKSNLVFDRGSFLFFSFDGEAQDDMIRSLDGSDPRLIEFIQNWFLEYPDPNTPYVFSVPEPALEGQFKQATIVDELLGQKRNGFFIECGAYDGEIFSNSLFFELKRNWTGLLIEPNRLSYAQLQTKNRKTYNINACLSSGSRAEVLHLINAGVLSGVTDAEVPDSYNDWRDRDFPENFKTKTPCFPLYSILLAVGNPRVDYFSLDVEGFEWEIIKSIPWDKVDITVVNLEVAHLGDKNPILENYMIEQGYKVAHRIGNEDIVFVKNDFAV